MRKSWLAIPVLGILSGSSMGAGCGGGDNGPCPPAAGQGITFAGSGPFQARGQKCLALINGFGGPGADLLNQLKSVPVTVNESSAEYSATHQPDQGQACQPQVVDWADMSSGTYPCSGAPRDPCAGLLHELQHTTEFYAGTAPQFPQPDASDEKAAVRIENWLLSMLGLCQRTCYDREPEPAPLEGVTWPVAGGQSEVRVSAGGMNLCQVVPPNVTLMVQNQTPDFILVSGQGDTGPLLCGGQNPYFRAKDSQRNCSLQLAVHSDRNPFAVPLTTLVAFFPSGDPNFPGGGQVIWSGESGAREPCGANAFSEYCQVALGENGSTQPPLQLARPRSRMVSVKYQPK